jgi:hypothetical protein
VLHRRRRTTVGLLLLAVVGAAVWLVGYATTAESGPARGAVAAPAPLVASVDAAGTPVGLPSGWRVAHVDRGRYVLDFASPVDLSLASWELTATVILRPLTPRSWQVDFVDDHHAIDSAFSFTATAAP